MFGNGSAKGKKSNLNVETLIGSHANILGDLVFSGGLHIDGRVVGSVSSEAGADALLVISEKGIVEGEIKVPHLLVNGTVKGDIHVTDHVELAANAKVEGNIHYRVIEMAAGAQVNGRIVRIEDNVKNLPKPEMIKKSESA